jgi:hypothetical protein
MSWRSSTTPTAVLPTWSFSVLRTSPARRWQQSTCQLGYLLASTAAGSRTPSTSRYETFDDIPPAELRAGDYRQTTSLAEAGCSAKSGRADRRGQGYTDELWTGTKGR